MQVDGNLSNYYGTLVTNSPGGTVVNNGVFSPATYVQAGGSTSGKPLSPATLVLSGGGTAAFQASSMTVQGGPLMAGQSIDIPAGGYLSLANDLTNDGTISMEASAGTGSSWLYMGGFTLTNAGLFSVPAGDGTPVYLYTYNGGSLVNTATMQVDGNLSNYYGTLVKNNPGGTVVNNGVFNPATYVQAGGSSSGKPLSPATLVLSGGGTAAFQASSMTVQGGPLMAGQSIDIPAGGSLSLANDLINDGTISMEASAGRANSYLNVRGCTLTNAGLFSVPAGDGTPVYPYNGSLVNTATMQVDGNLGKPYYYYYGTLTVTNSASLTVGATGTLAAVSVTHSPGGTVVNTGVFNPATYVQA